MRVEIDINISLARNVLELSSGSIEECNMLRQMNDEQIKDKVLSHIKCWGIKEIAENSGDRKDE